jgi:hypothetical protein
MKPKSFVIAALLLCATAEAQTWLAPVKSPIRYGLENENGEVITEAIYDELMPQGSDAFLARTAKGYGIIDAKGNQVIANNYQKLLQYRKGMAVVAKPVPIDKTERQRGYYYGERNDSILKMGVTDKSGKLLTDSSWSFIIIGEDGNMLVSADGKKYGYLDATGKELLPAVYDFASVFKEERAVISTGGRHGNMRLSLLYGSYGTSGDPDNTDYTGGTWEIINPKGEKITTGAYDYIRDYKESRAAFNKGGMWNTYKRYDNGDPRLTGGSWGFLDASGKEIIAAQYDYVSDFDNGVAQVMQGERTFYIDVNGKETVAPARKTKTFPYPHVYCKMGYAGYIDPSGKMLIPAIYEDATEFSEGLAAVVPVKNESNCGDRAPDWYRDMYTDRSATIYDEGDYYRPRIFRKFDNALLLKQIADSLLIDSLMRAESHYKPSDVTDYYGYIDKTGKLVIPAQFDVALPFHNGRAYVRIAQRWGIIDKAGNWIMKPILEEPEVNYVDNEYAAYEYHPDYVPAHFENAEPFVFSENMGIIYKFGKYGFVNAAGKIIVAPMYDQVKAFSSGLAAVRAGDKWGFIDKTGKLVIPLKFSEAFPFAEGVALVRHEIISENDEENTSEYDRERFGFIDTKGNWIIPPMYQNATSFSEGVAAVTKNWNSYQFIDKNGKPVIAGPFTVAASFKNGFAAVRKSGTDDVLYIDHKGKTDKKYTADFPPPGKAPLIPAENKVSDNYGFRNTKGEWIIPATYERAGSFTIAD